MAKENVQDVFFDLINETGIFAVKLFLLPIKKLNSFFRGTPPKLKIKEVTLEPNEPRE